MASIDRKYLLWPGLFVVYRTLFDHAEGGYWHDRFTKLYQRTRENFVVSARNKKEDPGFVPTYRLPEFAEYAGKLSCPAVKRKRMFVAHMYCKSNKKVLDAHRNTLCKYLIDPDAEFVVCPSIAYLDYVDQTFPQCVKLGVQNIYPKDEGNYTGEISLPMVKELGATYVLVGTRHRRRYLGETDKFIKKKVKESIEHGMKCIVFVNVTHGPFDECSMKIAVNNQIQALACGLGNEDWENVALACEMPPYTDNSKDEISADAQASRAQTMCRMVRQAVSNGAGDSVGNRVQILYAGDVCHTSAPLFMAKEDIDGIVFCPKGRSECFVNIVNSGLLADQRRKLWPPKEPTKKWYMLWRRKRPIKCDPRRKGDEEEDGAR